MLQKGDSKEKLGQEVTVLIGRQFTYEEYWS